MDDLDTYIVSAVVETREPKPELVMPSWWKRLWGKKPVLEWEMVTKECIVSIALSLTPAQAEWIRNHPEPVLSVLARGDKYHTPKFYRVL